MGDVWSPPRRTTRSRFGTSRPTPASSPTVPTPPTARSQRPRSPSSPATPPAPSGFSTGLALLHLSRHGSARAGGDGYDALSNVVVIVAVWWASHGSGPPL